MRDLAAGEASPGAVAGAVAGVLEGGGGGGGMTRLHRRRILLAVGGAAVALWLALVGSRAAGWW